MGINVKELENAPDWVDHLGPRTSIQDASKVLKEMDENQAYSVDELDESVHVDVYVNPSLMKQMVSAEIIKEKGGLFYIQDKSRAKEIIKLSEK